MKRSATTSVSVACLLVLLATAAAAPLRGQTAPATRPAETVAPPETVERAPPPPPPGRAEWATPLLVTGVAILTAAIVLALARRHRRHTRGSKA